MKPRLVDLSKDGYVIEPRYYFWGWSKAPKIVGHEQLAADLRKAKRLLPRNWNFKIWDCQRPRFVQILMLESFKRRFRARHPDWSKTELEKTLYTFGARPYWRTERLDVHRSGGAVDLTIVDAEGRELWMGTDHDDLTEVAALAYFEIHPAKHVLDFLAKKNRRFLSRVMRKAGFKKYDPEWWHWMYGGT
jgi:D-alanyl-D-alanine dipeptidase